MAGPGNEDEERTGDTALDSLKGKSLKAAGYAYLVGDAALWGSGLMSGRYPEAATGALWAAGGVAVARYGNPGADKQLQFLSARLGKYLKKQNVEIPQAPDTAMLTKEGGLIDRAESFLYSHPSQTLSGFFTAGGLLYMYSGKTHNKPWDIASGALVTAGALAGLLIPEKQPDPDHPAEGVIGKAAAFIQEKPLRVSGILYGVNNITTIASAIDEMRTNPSQKSYLFKFLNAGSYIFANTMLAISSKHHEGGKETQSKRAMEQLANASALVIAAQAPQVQEALVQNISGFLAAQHEVHMKAPEIAQLLHGKLEEVARSGALTQWQSRVQEKGAGETSPSL